MWNVLALGDLPPPIAHLGERLGRKLKDVRAFALQTVKSRSMDDPTADGIGLLAIEERPDLPAWQSQANDETSDRVLFAARANDSDDW